MPTVSIIIPTKNRCALLAETLVSVQKQSYQDWECLVIDDGSSDGTTALMSGLTDKDTRISFIRREGEKVGANVCRNQGLHWSRGELVLFLDSDDLLAPHCLDRRVAILLRNLDLDFAVFGALAFAITTNDLSIPFHSQVSGDDLLRFLTNEYPWQTTGPIWRRTALERLGGFDETLPSWQDVDLHIRALCLGMKYLRFATVDYYVRWQFEETKVSVLQRHAPGHLVAAETTLQKFEHAVRNGSELDWLRQRALCGLYFSVAEQWVATGDLRNGIRCWRLAAERNLSHWRLFCQGLVLLLGLSVPLIRSIVSRFTHKWKGWVRFRINPDLV